MSSTLTEAQYLSIIVIGRLTATLSMIGSSCIIYITLQGKRYAKNMMHRIMLGLSFSDLFLSFGLFLAPFLLPTNTGAPWAVGNTASCSFVGVSIQAGISVAIYNCYLTVYFLMSIKNASKRISRRSEICMHTLAILWPVTTAVAALATQSINYHELSNTCSTEPYPPNCLEDESIACTRGGEGTLYISYAYITPVVLSCLVSIGNTVVIYLVVRKNDTEERKRSKAVATQSLLYTLNFVNTFAWPVIFVVVAQSSTGDLFWLQLITNTIYPLQGLFNFFIYARVRVQRWSKAHPEQSHWWAFTMIFTGEAAPTGISRSSRGSSGNKYHSATTTSQPGSQVLSSTNLPESAE